MSILQEKLQEKILQQLALSTLWDDTYHKRGTIYMAAVNQNREMNEPEQIAHDNLGLMLDGIQQKMSSTQTRIGWLIIEMARYGEQPVLSVPKEYLYPSVSREEQSHE